VYNLQLEKKIKFKENRRGVAPALSTILMVAVTVAAMLLVISYSQTVIEYRSAQMGERLTIEKVIINSTHIETQIRNTGHGNLELLEVSINDHLYGLSPSLILEPSEGNPNANVVNVTIPVSLTDALKYEEGIYKISFISVLNKDLGHIDLSYSLSPDISDLNPEPYWIWEIAINDPTPRISATVSDKSTDGVDDISNIVLKLDDETVEEVSEILDAYNLSVYYDVPEASQLEEGFHIVLLEVTDFSGNTDSERWWFNVDITPPANVTGVTVSNEICGQLDISWSTNIEIDFDHYDIYRSNTVNPIWPDDYTKVDTTTTNSYSDEDVASSNFYYYVIIAVDQSGNESGWSYLEAIGEIVLVC
jgi:hypothetical protein